MSWIRCLFGKHSKTETTYEAGWKYVKHPCCGRYTFAGPVNGPNYNRMV